ncbi:MAG: O-antigen ligase family protein [Daejeonella sp.]
MLIFPLLYISAFLSALKDIFNKNPQGGFIFLIFGLSIYNTTLSILYQAGYRSFIFLFQPFKEIIILAMLGTMVWHLKERIRPHVIDYAVVAYLVYTGLYVLLPIGEFGFSARLLAFKSTSFFALIYCAGRLIDIRTLEIKKYFHFILVLAIAAAILVLYESVIDTHFQSLTGYSDYIYDFFGQEPEGNYGLTWTFERAESGLKRFASFFSDPLEHASAALLSISVIAGLFTQKNNLFNPSKLGMLAIMASLTSVMFSISRSSMASYFLVIYVYAFITDKKYILHGCHMLIAAGFIYLGYVVADKGLYEYILSTLTLQDASGLGHVVAWLAGLEAMVSNPLGLGLGASGRVSGSLGTSIGGENQFIILGVQIGIVGVLLYIFIHLTTIIYAYKWFPHLEGKERMVALTVFLLKIGISLPLFTANLDSYSYITYINWFLTGVLVNMIMHKQPPGDDAPVRNYEP